MFMRVILLHFCIEYPGSSCHLLGSWYC